MMNLSDKYNVWIIRIYGGAGHGKGLIGAMSSFAAKVILKRDIISHVAGSKVVVIFANHLDVTVEWVTQISIQSQLTRNGMTRKVIKPKLVCPNILLNVYQIRSKYLWECEECINLNFSFCLKEAIEPGETVEQVNVESSTEIEEKNDCE